MDHFIETSVARGFLHGTRHYKEYLNGQISGEKETTPFVIMELARSYLCGLIELYFTLDLDTIDTVSDAMRLWSQRFAPRDVKLGLLVVADILDLFDEQCRVAGVRLRSPNDKRYALATLV